MTTTDTATADIELDVRGLPCSDRRAIIFGNFHQLADGESLVVINDHEPVGLRGHFEEIASGHYRWDCRQLGPNEFRVRITREAFSADLARQGAEALANLGGHGCNH